ncbi:MAG: hypothetical protein V1809_06695 [Planctomycetota bacterium]
MTLWRLAANGLRFHRRTHAGVLAGTALAGAILTGALLVGDSARYHLDRQRRIRLGKIEFALDARNRFFRDDLAADLARASSAKTAAVMSLAGSALRPETPRGERRQVNRIRILGVDETFWNLAPGGPSSLTPPPRHGRRQ